MSSSFIDPKQTDDRIYQQCIFQITPLQITSLKQMTSNDKNNKKKQNSILIKLANITQKTYNLNQPMEFNIPISYSKTLIKYYPIKGMIKIYDKTQNGSQMILGVGGFSTDDILNQGLTYTEIYKEVGPVKVKLGIKANKQNKNWQKIKINQTTSQNSEISSCFKKQKQKQKQKDIFSQNLKQNQSHQFQRSIKKKISLTSVNSFKLSDIQQGSQGQLSPIKKFTSTQRVIGQMNNQQSIKRLKVKLAQSQSFSLKDQTQSLTQSQFNRDIIRKQMQTLGEQLIKQRKRNEVLQQKLNKSYIKVGYLKKRLYQGTQNQNNQNYQVNLNEKQDDILKSIQKWQKQKIQMLEQIQQKDGQIRILKNLMKQKKNCLNSQQNLQKRLHNQRQQIIKLEQNLNSSNKQIKQLQQNNTYFKQKEAQSQSIIFSKDNTIDHLGKLISNQNKQLQQLKKQVKYFNKTISNLQLTNDQLKQEISQLNEAIQKYKSKYGQISNFKNRALQNQIKDCIRWIDSQGRDPQFNQAEQTMQSQFSHSQNFSQVIRSIQIQNLPYSQITGIRTQLLKILDKVDQLLNKTQDHQSFSLSSI